jgi:hypothetical protein
MKQGRQGRKESVLGSYQKWDMITGGSQKMSERVIDERTDKEPVGELPGMAGYSLYQFFEGGSLRIVIHGVLRTGLTTASGSVPGFFFY